jgi:hypothetical protein
MWWKHFSGLPGQSLLFGAAVGILAWLLSSYLPGGRYHAIGARDHSRSEPYDLSGRRPGGWSGDYYTGRGLLDEGR